MPTVFQRVVATALGDLGVVGEDLGGGGVRKLDLAGFRQGGWRGRAGWQGSEGGEKIGQDFFDFKITDDGEFEVALGEFGGEPLIRVVDGVGGKLLDGSDGESGVAAMDPGFHFLLRAAGRVLELLIHHGNGLLELPEGLLAIAWIG